MIFFSIAKGKSRLDPMLSGNRLSETAGLEIPEPGFHRRTMQRPFPIAAVGHIAFLPADRTMVLQPVQGGIQIIHGHAASIDERPGAGPIAVRRSPTRKKTGFMWQNSPAGTL